MSNTTSIIDSIFTSLVNSLLQMWYIFPILLIGLFFKSSYGKGIVGEFMVNLFLNNKLDKEKYHLLKNITLPTEEGTTQLDHVLVSPFGIFVIETKNMKGWIFGNEHQKTWTQKIYKHTSKFQNPLHQNYKHIKTIESLLELGSDKIYSIIVFVGDSTFKTDMPLNVTRPQGLIDFIKSKKTEVLSSMEVEKILTLIETGRLSKTLKTHINHVKHVKSIIEEKEPNCPRCGSKLVERTVKKGENKGKLFYGCSSFPKCRYSKDIV